MNKNIKNKSGLTEKEFLEQYNPNLYEKPSVTTDMVLFTIDDKNVEDARKNSEKILKILLIKRKDHPFINQWALPGGFVQINEGLKDAAYRELKEETNVVDDVYLEQLYTFGDDVKRDPRMRIISSVYMALTPKENIKKTIAGDDACDAKWFDVSIENVSFDDVKKQKIYKLVLTNDSLKKNITYLFSKSYILNKNKKTIDTKIIVKSVEEKSDYKLAFDHIRIIDMALERLKNKVEYTPIAFNLLPNEFTLAELQQTYEILLQRKLVKQNFRTKMLPMLVKTDTVKDDSWHRPALYYKYNPYWEFEIDTD